MNGCRRMLVAMVCMLLVVSACNAPVQVKEPVTLMIGGAQPAWFKGEYGEQLEINGREITVKLIPHEEWPRQEYGFIDMEKLLDQFEPDIVYWSSYYSLSPYIEAGRLQPLDEFIQRSGEELGHFAPFLLEQLREEGDGRMYAWPAAYSAEVLFYNKTLFDKYDVPYPPEAPSWGDVFQRVRELSHMTRDQTESELMYPYLSPGSGEPAEKLFWLLRYAGKTERLQSINPDTWNVTANSAEWSRLWSLFIDDFKQGLLSNEAYEGDRALGLSYDEKYRVFLEGRAATVVGSPDLLYLLLKQDKFDWGIAQQPGKEQIYLQVPEMYAINANSAQKEAAWELISYLNSEENVKNKLAISVSGEGFGSYYGRLPARIGVMEQTIDMDLSPFYEQPLAEMSIYNENYFTPELFTYMKEQTVMQIEAVLNDEKSVDQALEDLQALLEVGVTSWLAEGAGQ